MTADYLFIFWIVTGAYFVRGLTGFGSALISVPLLVLWQPLHLVVPMVMTLDFLASFFLGGLDARQTDWSEIKRLLPFSLIGTSVGVFALMRLPSAPILISLGLFTMYFGLRNARGIGSEGRISALWAVPTGLIGSGAASLFGTSGPPYVIYLTHRLQNKTAVRATFSWLFVLDGGFRLLLLALAGLLLQLETQVAILAGVIPMVAGLYLGNRVHVNISRERLLRVIGYILLMNGATLIVKVSA